MTSALRRATFLAGSALTCVAAPAFATAETADQAPERDYLPAEIVVTGSVDGYSNDDGSSGTKTPTPLIDVPQTVATITDDQLEDQAITQLSEALRYVPGVSTESGEGNRDAVFIRGQETTADFYLDGLRDDAQYYRSLYNVERVEVLKGPNALIFGRGGGGGAINRVSKTAKVGDSFIEGDASADTFGAFAIGADLNQPLSDSVALRIAGTYEEFNNDRDFYDGRFIGITPTITAQLGPDTRLTASYTYDDDSRLADRGIPSFNGAPLFGFEETLFGVADFNISDTEVNIARARIDHDFSDALSANVSVQFADYDKLYANVVPSGSDGASVTLSGYRNDTDRQNLIGQANFIWQVNTGSARHMVLFGFEAGDQNTDDSRLGISFATATGPESRVTIPLADVLAIPAVSLTAPIRARDTQLTTFSAYLQDQIDIGDHVQIIAGVRWDRFDLESRDQIGGGINARMDEKFSPRAGLVIKPNENLSLYASYAQSFLPQSGDQFTSLSTLDAGLEPEKFTNYEIGAKWLIRSDLFFTAALFQLDRTNTTAPDPLTPGNVVLTGSTRTKGIELNLVGKITPQWQANIGYTYLDGEIRNDTESAPAGTRLEQLPEHQISLWNRFQFTDSFAAGLGVVYQDEQFASVSNAVTLPDYWRVDAAVFYDINERVSLQVNIENLFDETYYPAAHGDNNIQPAEPFSARFGVRVRM
ncbi:TonB-dependent receptor [Parerythrobacter aestuarii]|uniref:TonB-dependent receptor n=1 Tax=Parerythrobacter aestuarii TaxID=3020909 RepID=UPI0024DE80FF|nr:TonB-dependent siderophore receptor [Parerythrobacter aestuarii]